MAHRFTDTDLWNEDWFCDMGAEYQLFFNYVTSKCDNAGIWKPNKIDFEIKSRAKINLDSFLLKVNESGSKERIIVIEGGRWFLTGFISYQWFTKQKTFDLALSNKLHLHIFNLLQKNNVPLQKVRGLTEVLQTSKVKVKVKVKDEIENSVEISEEENQIHIGQRNGHQVSIRPTYLHERPIVIHSLQEYFKTENQLEAIQKAGWIKFEEFMKHNPAAVFNGKEHLYNAFRSYHLNAKEEPRKKFNKQEIFNQL
jgi:hypothetical protein